MQRLTKTFENLPGLRGMLPRVPGKWARKGYKASSWTCMCGLSGKMAKSTTISACLPRTHTVTPSTCARSGPRRSTTSTTSLFLASSARSTRWRARRRWMASALTIGWRRHRASSRCSRSPAGVSHCSKGASWAAKAGSASARLASGVFTGLGHGLQVLLGLFCDDFSET